MVQFPSPGRHLSRAHLTGMVWPAGDEGSLQSINFRWLSRPAPARLARMGAGPLPEVFTLVPPDDRFDAQARLLDVLQGRLPRGWERTRPLSPDQPAPTLVFRRHLDGRVTADGFPDEVDVCEALVSRLDPQVVRLERGRLYLEVANGAAVYVPVGPSLRPGCRRYGRLYLRRDDR